MKNKKKRIIFRGLIGLLVFLVLLLVFLVLFSIDFISFSKNSINFEIKDECSLVLDNLIHQIKDEGICRMMCINECDIRDMDFYKSVFSPKENSCSLCDCYCK
jgi:hypothetical protein